MRESLLIVALLSSTISFVYAADSEGNREDKIIMIGLTPVGLHAATLIAPPLRIGAFINSDIMLNVDSGSTSYSESSGTAKATATYTNQGLNGRYFLGNSFNISTGYHIRNYSAEATSTSGSASATITLDAKTSVLTLGIGNHWLTDWGFWIGGDWALLSGPINQSSESTVTSTTGGEISSAKSDVEKIGDLINTISSTSGFAVLTIGFAI